MHTPHHLDRIAQLAVFLICTSLFAYAGVRHEFNGLLSDSYVYLAAAAALDGDRSMLQHIVATYPFPPLFPLVLGLAGGGSLAPERSYLIGALLLAGVCVLFLRWLRAEGVPGIAAVLASLAFALLPLTLQSAMGVLSEPLFMLLVLAAMLALPTRSTPPRRVARAWWLAALFVALASLTRSVGVAAIAAYLASWTYARGWRVAQAAPVLAGLPFATWTLVKKLGGASDYSVTVIARQAPWDMIAVNARAWQQFAVKAVDLMMRPHVSHALAVIAAMASVVWLYRLARGRFDAWYLALYLAIMVVWPYPHHAARFLFVLLPLVLGYVLWGLSAVVSRLQLPRPARPIVPALVPVVLILLALPSTLSMLQLLWIHRDDDLQAAVRAPAWYQTRPAESLRGARFAQRIVDFQRSRLALTPADACVASVVPQQVLVYGPRRGIDLTQVRARGQTLDAALAQCPYVLMLAARPYPPMPGVGSLFPLDEIRDRMDVIAFERDRPGDDDSPLVAMLAKMR